MILEKIRCDCKNCTERYVGCHATCDKYKDFVRRNEEIKQKYRYDKAVSRTTSWMYRKKKEEE